MDTYNIENVEIGLDAVRVNEPLGMGSIDVRRPPLKQVART